MMNRRFATVVSVSIGITVPLALVICARANAGQSPASHVEWGYTGPSGPTHWAEKSKDYAICARGQQESPLDLRGAIRADLGIARIAWHRLPLRVMNNGHTIQIDAPAGASLRLGSKHYALTQFHIHHPSEHLRAGRRFPLEMHFVHKAAGGVLGVVGIFVTQGRHNPALQAVLDAAPMTAGATRTAGGKTIDPAAFLPANRRFYRYEGSLTTPPCSESVDWVIMHDPIEASPRQIRQFAAIYPFNARPIQALNRRFLLQSR